MRLSRAALAGVLLVAGCTGADEPPAGAEWLRNGRVIDTEATAPPPADAPGWRSVELPDRWRAARRERGTAGWYELPFQADPDPGRLHGVYLPSFGLNASVFVNGTPVGSGGRMDEWPTRNWNRPLYFPFPGTLLEPGRNVAQVRLRTSRTSFGLLLPVMVGPDAVLRPLYEERFFYQVRVREIMTALVVGMGILLGFVSLRAPDVRGVGWMAATALLFGLSSADALVPDPPLPQRPWQWLNQLSLLACAACAVISAHRTVGVRAPRVEALLATLLAAIALLHAAVPDLLVPGVALVNVTLGAALSIYLVAFVVRHRNHALRVPRWLAVGASLAAAALVAHDVLLGLDVPVPFRFLLFPYLGSLLLLLVSVFVIRRFVEALRESEALNRELEARVREKHEELERNYARLALLERDRVVAAERARLTRDMHDGVGGQLVAALAMVEHGAFGGEEVAHVLRDAIDDLRLVIDSLDPGEADLPELLGLVRERLEPRLRRHGVQFSWKVEDIPRPAGFAPPQALSALRIVQESITNVMKHAAARVIEVRTGVVQDDDAGRAAFVEVRDDGRGFPPGAGPGRGLRNMRQRAAELGGRLDIASGAGGTSVRLVLSLAPPDEPDAAAPARSA